MVDMTGLERQPKTLVCRKCGQKFKSLSGRHWHCDTCKKIIKRDGMREWHRNHLEQVAVWRRRTTRKVKLEVITHYGGRCACCGETEPLFLTIDHINGGGTAHRKEIGYFGSSFYIWLRRENYPEGYQVLCFNCNCARGLNGGICPHEQ